MEDPFSVVVQLSGKQLQRALWRSTRNVRLSSCWVHCLHARTYLVGSQIKVFGFVTQITTRP